MKLKELYHNIGAGITLLGTILSIYNPLFKNEILITIATILELFCFMYFINKLINDKIARSKK